MVSSSQFFSTSSYWSAVVGVSLLKLLLINSYRSTDFEVHRNWLAITHSLPLEKWYYESTSEWTLDYPPFFAYFEWTLSQIAKHFDKDMLVVSNLNYASFHTVLFQKLSVIFVDLVLAYAILRCNRTTSILFQSTKEERKSGRLDQSQQTNDSLATLFVLVFLNAGLFLVDHIHFQYNGFLFGILLLSISACLEGKLYQCAFIFAVLINLKHIFLYVAPAYGIYLLRRKCFPLNVPINIVSILTSISCFGLVGVSVLAASFGPFVQHIPQILKRLFPFQRGLSHAYWAPNFWAVYNTIDWILNFAQKRGKSSVTTGLVGEAALSVLPQVLPLHTLILTVVFMMPALYALWRDPSERNFIRGVVVTGWTSFMFGYHVHEKAILNVLIPFSLIALHEPRTYFIALVSGTVSLFPLLFSPTEIVLKAIITILHLSLTLQVLPRKFSFNILEKMYLSGFVLVYLCENLGPFLLPKLPFLPLILVSDYCFLGIFYTYVRFYWRFLRDSTSFPKESHVDNNVVSPQKTEKENLGKKKKSKTSQVSNSPPSSPSSPTTRVLRKRIVKL